MPRFDDSGNGPPVDPYDYDWISPDIGYQYFDVYGPSNGQMVLIGLAGGAAAGLIIGLMWIIWDWSRDRRWERTEAKEPVGVARLRSWVARFGSRQVEDAAELVEVEPVARWTPEPKFAANGTKVHRIDCRHAEGADPIRVWTEEAAEHWAQAEGLAGCGTCRPFELVGVTAHG